MPASKKFVPIKILVAVDTVVVPQDWQVRLKNVGYEATILTCTTVEAALEAVTTEKPDLVVMNIRLGGIMSAAAAAQRIYDQHGTPVLFLSAKSLDHAIDTTVFHLRTLYTVGR